MLGFPADYKGAVNDALMLHLLIWAAYREIPACRKTAITEISYNKAMYRNFAFFNYLEKEEGTPAFHDAIKEDSLKYNHGILIAYLNLCFKQWPALANMNTPGKGILTVGVKSFVECFEEISGRTIR